MSGNLPPEEQDLIQRVLCGHQRAQRRLYERYVQAMYNTVIRMVANPMDAEDILQDAFVRVFQHLPQFKGESTLGAWIKRIVVNTALNFLRSRRRLVFLDGDIADTAAEPAELHEPERDMRRIHHAVKKLPEGCRVVFSLYLLEGYQHREIAQILDISESTSKSQYQRARRLLREELSARAPLAGKRTGHAG